MGRDLPNFRIFTCERVTRGLGGLRKNDSEAIALRAGKNKIELAATQAGYWTGASSFALPQFSCDLQQKAFWAYRVFFIILWFRSKVNVDAIGLPNFPCPDAIDFDDFAEAILTASCEKRCRKLPYGSNVSKYVVGFGEIGVDTSSVRPRILGKLKKRKFRFWPLIFAIYLRGMVEQAVSSIWPPIQEFGGTSPTIRILTHELSAPIRLARYR